MDFVTYNIQYSRGKDNRHDLERIAAAVQGADVIGMQEVARNMPGVPDGDHPSTLSEMFSSYYWVYGPPVDLDASEVLADGRVVNKRFQFGNMLLSRYPILSSRLILLPRQRTYDSNNVQCSALEAVVDLPSGPLRVYVAHLNSRSSEERLAQIDFLLPRLWAIPREGGTVTGPSWRDGKQEIPMSEDCVIMGDFNLTPVSPEYIRIVGEADYYYGRRIVAHRLVDSWVLSGQDAEAGLTWYDESKEWKSGSRLDYGFVTAGLASKVTAARIDEAAPGSDHQPYWFSLSL